MYKTIKFNCTICIIEMPQQWCKKVTSKVYCRKVAKLSDGFINESVCQVLN